MPGEKNIEMKNTEKNKTLEDFKEDCRDEATIILRKQKKEMNEFLKNNPDKKIESWGHYPLTTILEKGDCPYSSNRPLGWTTFRKAFTHFKNHLLELGNLKPEKYTDYAKSVLLQPISPNFPAFFSLEPVSKDMLKGREKTSALAIKLYRFDKKTELIVVGNQYGLILSCFPVKYKDKNQSKYEYFTGNFIEEKKRIESNRNELSKRSGRQSDL